MLISKELLKIDTNPLFFVGSTMIVKILQGVPFLVDAATKTLYAYEKVPSGTPLRLGTYNPETETFELRPDWKDAYASKVEDHRKQEKPRSRVATSSTGGK